jgi:hypothetical protein
MASAIMALPKNRAQVNEATQRPALAWIFTVLWFFYPVVSPSTSARENPEDERGKRNEKKS